MADILDIRTIERGAARQMEVAKKVRELNALIANVFPGYELSIARGSTSGQKEKVTIPTQGDFGDLPLLAQVETVLRSSKRPMQKKNLLKEIHSRGGDVSANTLSIYLSRYPQFVRRGHGKWSINRKNGNEDDS
jgi:hypothetical protein